MKATADDNRIPLGFMPAQAYDSLALQEKILVAVDSDAGNERYIGHLIFGGTFPTRRIFQTVVSPNARRQGVGTALIRALIQKSENENYLRVAAHVASDLDIANSFYEAHNFKEVVRHKGKKSTKRELVIRVLELDTPNLFNHDPTEARRFALRSPSYSASPRYLLDLNVFFDVAKDRPDEVLSSKLLSLSFSGFLRLAVAQEFIGELERTTAKIPNDIVLNFAKGLPLVQQSRRSFPEELLSELAILIFPERAQNKKLSAQDESDIRHIATAILEGLSGFITREKAILARVDSIRDKYGVDVVSPDELLLLHDQNEGGAVNSNAFNYSEEFSCEKTHGISPDIAASILSKVDVDTATTSRITTLIGERESYCAYTIRKSSILISAGIWDTRPQAHRQNELFVFAALGSSHSELCLDHTIAECLRSMQRQGISYIYSSTSQDRYSERRALQAHGFRSQTIEKKYELFSKVSVPFVAHRGNWAELRKKMKLVGGISFGKKFPATDETANICGADGSVNSVQIKQIENLLSPIIFVSEPIGGAIVPIRRGYSEDLLGCDEQRPLLPLNTATLFSERAYFSSPANRSVLSAGKPIVFYESGTDKGRKAAVAVARIKESTVVSKAKLSKEFTSRGVLDDQQIVSVTSSNDVLATRFDNIIIFRAPVSFSKLKKLDCVGGANLVKAQNISAAQLVSICSQGGVCD